MQSVSRVNYFVFRSIFNTSAKTTFNYCKTLITIRPMQTVATKFPRHSDLITLGLDIASELKIGEIHIISECKYIIKDIDREIQFEGFEESSTIDKPALASIQFKIIDVIIDNGNHIRHTYLFNDAKTRHRFKKLCKANTSEIFDYLFDLPEATYGYGVLNEDLIYAYVSPYLTPQQHLMLFMSNDSTSNSALQ